MIIKAVQTGSNFFEWVHRRATGENFYANVLLSRDKIEGQYFLHAVVRDISESKKTEKILQDSEERFKSIFDEASDGILLVDAKTSNFYTANKTFCRQLGYNLEEIKKLKVADIHPQKNLPYVLAQFKKITKNESKTAKDIPVKRKDGSIFYADINTATIKIEGRSCLIGFFHDITERRALEQARVRISEAKEKVLLENMGEGVVATDQAGKIIFINRMAEKLLGWSAEQVMGRLVDQAWEIFDEKDQLVLVDKRPLTMALKNKTTIASSSYFYTRKDGAKFPVAINVAPVMVRNKIISAMEVFRDITQEKEIERAKSDFVSIASHQLRTPLTSIQWLTECLEKETLTPRGQEYLNDIKTSVKNLNKLVELLLNVSRIQAGKISLFPQTVEAIDLVEKVMADLEPLYEKKDLAFTLESPAKIMMKTDVSALQNIVQVLFSNAIDYTPVSGHIKVKIKKHGQKILLTVSDNGIGIPLKDQEYIFQEFKRASNAGRLKAAGIGMGLWLAKQAADSLGGRIWLQSREDQGSTFFVELPLKSKATKLKK